MNWAAEMGRGEKIYADFNLYRSIVASSLVDGRQFRSSPNAKTISTDAPTASDCFANNSSGSTPYGQKDNFPMSNLLPLRLLIAEDNIVNQKVMQRTLSQLGYGADVVDNGLEVLEALAQRRYDLIFMDIRMPEMDGLMATKQIVQTYAEAERPIVIAVTANAAPDDRTRCMRAGMDDFIPKPIRKDMIQAQLMRWGPTAIHRAAASLARVGHRQG